VAPLLVLAGSLCSGVVSANCLIRPNPTSDVVPVTGHVLGSVQAALKGYFQLNPCSGTVAVERVSVLFSKGAGETFVRMVRQGQRLEEATGPGPFRDLNSIPGMTGVLYKVATGPTPQQPGSRKFDALAARPLGGEVLAGVPLRISLEKFSWSPSRPVEIRFAQHSAVLSPDAQGQVVLAATDLVAGRVVHITQGDRKARLMPQTLSEFGDLRTRLQELETGQGDEHAATLARVALMADWGLMLNAMDILGEL
jgi:hypothetical protein